MSMFLTEKEIAELTGRTQRRTQRTVLNSMGIEHKVRPDNSIVIARAHIEKILDAQHTGRKIKEAEPDWNAI
jgi:hypothetical protein